MCVCVCIVVIQSLSHVWLFVTPWTAARQAFLSFNHLLDLAQTHVHWVGNAFQPSRPLLFPSPFAFSLSQHQGLFQWVGAVHRVAKVLEPQLQHQYFQRIFRIGSFRIDWFDLLAVHTTLKSLLQHHSLKASILWCSAFFIVQLSYLYMTAGKTIALTIRTFVGKVMSLLFNISAALVCHSFSSKEQTSFNFMVSVTICSDFGTQEKKICHCFHFFLFYLQWSDGTRYHVLSFLNAWVLSQLFHSPPSLSSRGILVPFCFLS